MGGHGRSRKVGGRSLEGRCGSFAPTWLQPQRLLFDRSSAVRWGDATSASASALSPSSLYVPCPKSLTPQRVLLSSTSVASEVLRAGAPHERGERGSLRAEANFPREQDGAPCRAGVSSRCVCPHVGGRRRTWWPPESIRINQDQSESIRINQDQSGSIRINQDQPGSIRINQDQSESIRINQNQSESIRINQNQSESTRINQNQSE